LDELVRRVKDSKERLDVLIINPNDESVDVAEVFSLPRVCKAAQQAGLKCGGSYDILNGWDLRVEGKRKELREHLRTLRPRLLIVCPPCGPFSQLQELNKMRNLKGYLQKLSEGKMLLRFAMELCKDQMDRGDLFLFEHPQGAKSWSDPSVQKLLHDSRVYKETLDQCMYGLKDHVSGKPHRKRTGIMVNCESVAKRLRTMCDRTHEHEHVMGCVKTKMGWKTRSRMAQAYPPKLVQAMIQGLKDDEKSRQQSMVTYSVFTVESLETDDEKKIVRILKRCHENLGHPSNQRFVSMLKAARASETCLKLAKGLTCSTCREMMGEKSHNVSKTLKDLEFNDMISVDTFELELDWRKVKLLNVVDLATRFQVVVPLWKGIEIKKVRKAYRRSWKRWAGVPRILISDGGPEFGTEWTDMLASDGTTQRNCCVCTLAEWNMRESGVCVQECLFEGSAGSGTQDQRGSRRVV